MPDDEPVLALDTPLAGFPAELRLSGVFCSIPTRTP
jgi:hypothetical protein